MAEEILRPNAYCYSSLVQWDASAGNNSDCVDEVEASDADYVSTSTQFESELYAVENTSDASGETINSVTN